MKITPWINQELDKRQIVPFTVIDNCPKCGEEWNSDKHDYFGSYMPVNKPYSEEFYCEKCEKHWERNILITMDIKEVP